MKKLKLENLPKVSGGTSANEDSIKIQDGYLKTTLHIAPHEFEQYLDVCLVVQNSKNISVVD